MPKRVYFVANTSIGVPGNIGFRIQKICDQLEVNPNFEFEIFARYSKTHKNNNTNLYVIFSRFLNLVRIRLFSKLNSRKIDDWVFEKLEGFISGLRSRRIKRRPPEVVHFFGMHLDLMKKYRALGSQVVLDIPILPNFCVDEISKSSKGAYEYTPDVKYEAMERACCSSADKIVVPSEFVRSLMLLKMPELATKIVTVPFGVEASPDAQPKPKGEFESAPLGVLFAGNVSPRKGIEVLQAVSQSVSSDQFNFDICGRIYAQRYTWQKEGTVFHGFTSVDRFMEKNQFFIHPTYMEGSAKAVYEAMSKGMVVLTTPNAGSVITNCFDGIVLEKNDPDQFVSIMSELVNDPERCEQLSRNAVSTAQKYSWERYGASLCDQYASVQNTS